MSTINVTLSEDLHTQIVLLAVHDGVTPSQFVARAIAEKIERIEEDGPCFFPGALGRCAESTRRPLTIISLPYKEEVVHDHLMPYLQT